MSTNVQLKGNTPNDPWWVIEGTPGEIVQQIAQVFPDLYTDQPAQFPSVVAKARAAWAAQMTVANGLGGTEVQHQVPAPAPQGPPQGNGWGSPAQSTPAPQGQAAAGPTTETDRYGNRYELGRPDAPMSPFGPAVKKTGQSKAGKPYSRWIDPRDPYIPSNKGQPKPDDLWEGKWA